MVSAIIIGPFTALFFPALCVTIGWLIGYGFSSRYRKQYLDVARELANLRGENFRGELPTLSSLRNEGPRLASTSPPLRTDQASPDATCHASHDNPELDPPKQSSQDTTLPDQNQQLLIERETLAIKAKQAQDDVEQLRILLATQEAAIASLERERDAFRTRAELAERHAS